MSRFLVLAVLAVAVSTINVTGFQPLSITTNRVAIMATDISNSDQKQRGEQSNGENSLALKLNVTNVQQRSRQKVQIIGHRGSLYTSLENTSRSFLHALQAGADGVELDVFLLKCGTLVVFHGSGNDYTQGQLDSYCDIPGSILDYTAEEAKRLLTFNKNYAEFGCGPDLITHPGDPSHYCYVHTLEEVLVTLREASSSFIIKIELKGPNTAIPSVELVNKLNMSHRCHYSSFIHSRIAEVRSINVDAITGALFDDRLPNDFVQQAFAVGATEVHLKYDTCTLDIIQMAHQAGLRVMAWFRGPIGMKEDCNTKYFDVGNEDIDMYQIVLRSGVDSMCVNRPDIMVKTLAEVLS